MRNRGNNVGVANSERDYDHAFIKSVPFIYYDSFFFHIRIQEFNNRGGHGSLD